MSDHDGKSERDRLFSHTVRTDRRPVPETARLARAALAGVAGSWAACVVLAPYAPLPLAFAIYAIGATVCHQLPERSFHLGGSQLAVCARCTGIYVGAAVALVWHLTSVRLADDRLPQPDVVRARLWLVAGALPTLVTVAAEQAGLWFPSNILRAVAGAALGFATAFVVGRAATLHLHSVPSTSWPARH